MEDDKIIEYTTPEQQIDLLKSKGLSFENENFARDRLQEYGYYNIINGYKTPYIEIIDDKKIYKSGTIFEQIYSLFIFDHTLRNSVMSTMLDFEEHLRAAAAEVIANSFGTDHNEYLRWNNYRDRQTSRDRFSLRGILGTLRQNIDSGKDPIKYYRENYNIVPPWILFKGTYFSTLINFIRLFKEPQKVQMIKLVYDIDDSLCALPCMKKLFLDTLFTCLDYRNCAAHGGRIYTFEPRNAEDIKNNNELFKLFPELEDLKQRHGISQLLTLLSTFSYEGIALSLENTLRHEINRHLSLYVQDKEYLEKALGFEIIENRVAWITDSTKKFHKYPNCSGMQNPIQVSLDDIDLDIYQPCKRCWNK